MAFQLLTPEDYEALRQYGTAAAGRSPAGEKPKAAVPPPGTAPFSENKFERTTTETVAKPAFLDILDLAGGIDSAGKIRPGFLQSAQMLKENDAAYRQQEGLVKEQLDRLAQFEANKPKAQGDIWRNVMDIGDFMTDGQYQLLKNYTPRKSQEELDREHELEVLKQYDSVLKQGLGLGKLSVSEQKTLLNPGGYQQKIVQSDSKKAGFEPVTPKSTNDNQSNMFLRELRTKVQKNQDSYLETASQIKNLRSQLDEGNIESIRMVAGQLARVISGEKGMLTEGDKRDVVPRTFEGDFNKWISFLESRTSDPSQVMSYESIQALTNALTKAAANAHKKHADTLSGIESISSADPRYSTPGAADTVKNSKNFMSRAQGEYLPRKKSLLELLDERAKKKVAPNGK